MVVTGASGFVGRALMQRLRADGRPVRAVVKARGDGCDHAVAVGAIDGQTTWAPALAGCDVVVHLAARVHVMREEANDPLAAFRAVNVDGTVRLAHEAIRAGVRRLVFVSSVKIHGDASGAIPFTETAPSAPADAYSISKWEAEQELARIAEATGLEVVVLRPPLVYGPGVAGNFRRLLDTVRRGLPMPLGAVHNRRSLLYVENLADALVTCADHPAAAGRAFLVCDGTSVSTPELIRRCAGALGVVPNLWSVPVPILWLAGTMTRRAAAIGRLTGSLEVDDAAIRTVLGWRPRVAMDDALASTAKAYLAGRCSALSAGLER